MPNSAKSRTPIKRIAYQAHPVINVLAFNHLGQIDVFEFDNTFSQVDELAFDKSKRIDPSMLAKANILFQISNQMQLQPGISIENDLFIIEYLKTQISPNITNAKEVVDEIIESWNLIAELPISQRYQGFVRTALKTPLKVQGSYESTLHDYITSYLGSAANLDDSKDWHFLQINELISSTLEGVPFSTNPFIQLHRTIETIERCNKDVGQQAVLRMIKDKFERIQSKWFIDIDGLVTPEIENIIDDFLKGEYTAAQTNAIHNLLRKVCNEPLDTFKRNPEYNNQFPFLFDFMENPLDQKLIKAIPEIERPNAATIRNVIQYCVYKNLLDKAALYTKQLGKVFPRFLPTNKISDILQDEINSEASLIDQLLSGVYPEFIAKAISQKSRSAQIREIALQLVYTVKPIASAPVDLTYDYLTPEVLKAISSGSLSSFSQPESAGFFSSYSPRSSSSLSSYSEPSKCSKLYSSSKKSASKSVRVEEAKEESASASQKRKTPSSASSALPQAPTGLSFVPDPIPDILEGDILLDEASNKNKRPRT